MSIPELAKHLGSGAPDEAPAEQLNMNSTLHRCLRLWRTANNKIKSSESNQNQKYTLRLWNFGPGGSKIYGAYTIFFIIFPKALNQQMPAPPQTCLLVLSPHSKSFLHQCSSPPFPHRENTAATTP